MRFGMNRDTARESYVEVAVAGPLRRTFTYRAPAGPGELSPGQRLLVPFGRARKVGFYLGPSGPPEGVEARDIIRPIDPQSYFPSDLFELCTWMAGYYFTNPADCLAAALPPALKSEASPRLVWGEFGDLAPEAIKRRVRSGRRLSPDDIRAVKQARLSLSSLVQQEIIREVWPAPAADRAPRLAGYRAARLEEWGEYFRKAKIAPRPFDGLRRRAELLAEGWTAHYVTRAVRDGLLDAVYEEDTADLYDIVAPREDLDVLQPTDEQRTVLNRLSASVTADERRFSVHLLHGVTGSGKTLVYCLLAQRVIQAGRTVLVLTPEIALTGTTLAYFRGFFGDRVTVLHSAMTDRERLNSFTGIRSGKYDIVIGPRSAVFAPLERIGLIVVDEEHDGSYKQDDPAPRFHGRDSAIMRGRMLGVPVLLGSASPSIESYHSARSGKYELLELKERPAGASLPSVRLVDMKTSRLHGDLPFLSYPLKKEAERRLRDNEQVILFLNRRGYSPQLKCAGCGKVPSCPNCRVKLTYHKVGRKLSCHYCGWLTQQYDVCPHCQGTDFIYLGAGTQKVEETIPRLFEGAVAVRLDSDTATGRGKLREILTVFAEGKTNLLLGTQMVTKGLDLPRVTLVGVLSADLMLDFPDFRASERTFAQLLQVAGRSGRADRPGEVLIQTYYPEHEVIGQAATQDYPAFFENEIKNREELGYPPFSRLVNFVLSGKDERQVEREALAFAEALERETRAGSIGASQLGPAPCPMYYLRGVFRRHLFVKTKQIVRLVRRLAAWEAREPRFGVPASVKLVVDVDPDDMM